MNIHITCFKLPTLVRFFLEKRTVDSDLHTPRLLLKLNPRRAGERSEAEQSVSTNMAFVTVWFLEKPGTEFNAC